MKSMWHLGVIGGYGLPDPGSLEDAQEIAVFSPFGEPSGPVLTGFLAGVRCTFIARHGEGHRLPPGAVNYRANIDVLKRCGVTDVLSVSAVRSLQPHIAPGHFVASDQIIDQTHGRTNSFFTTGIVAQVSMADPVCSRLSAMAAGAVGAIGALVHRGGCYLAIEGPQFSTRAESLMYRQWGADVIGTTAMPEARLAREAELPYALLGMVTNYDAWRAGGSMDGATTAELAQANGDLARATLLQFARSLPEERSPSPIDHALDRAIITPRDQWDNNKLAELDAVAQRILLKTPVDCY